MSQILNYIFDTDKGYNFDPDKIRIESNRAELIPIISGAEAALYAKLDETQGLAAVDSSGNGRNGGFQGGYDENNRAPGKIGNGIVGISTSAGFINFDQVLEYEKNEAFSLECWFKTTSAQNMDFISKQSNSGNSPGFAMRFFAGKARFVIRDNLSGVLAIETIGTYNDGQWHHYAVTYDGSNSETGMKIYIDNVNDQIVSAAGTLTGSILTSADLQLSGRDGNNTTIDSNTILDEMVIYSRALNAAEVNFRWNSGNGTQDLPGADTSYPVDNPPIQPVNSQLMTEILTFSASITAVGSDNVFFVLSIDRVDFWWNGVSWVESGGDSESNTWQQINNNLSALSLPGISAISWKAFLHSDTGETTPFLLSVETSYNIELQEPTLNQAIISGIRLGLDGNPRESEIIKVNARWLIGENTEIDNEQIQTITNDQGEWQIILNYENVPPDYLDWYFGNKYYQTNFLPGIVKFSQLTILKEG